MLRLPPPRLLSTGAAAAGGAAGSGGQGEPAVGPRVPERRQGGRRHLQPMLGRLDSWRPPPRPHHRAGDDAGPAPAGERLVPTKGVCVWRAGGEFRIAHIPNGPYSPFPPPTPSPPPLTPAPTPTRPGRHRWRWMRSQPARPPPRSPLWTSNPCGRSQRSSGLKAACCCPRASKAWLAARRCPPGRPLQRALPAWRRWWASLWRVRP